MSNAIESPLRFVIGHGYGDGCICCPVCGYEYVHLGPVNVVQGETHTLIERERTTVLPSERGKKDRGSLVELSFVGECGHSFVYAFRFHKGITETSLAAYELPPGADWPATLWRD